MPFYRRVICNLGALVLAVLLALACAGGQPHLGQGSLANWERLTSEVRELPLLEHVASRWISRKELRKILETELKAEYAAEYVERYRDAYAAMGLLPPELNLLESLLDLLQEQLVGLYSVNRRTLYVVEEAELGEGGFDRMVIVHELVHALQHQHYPLTVELLQKLRGNDDLEAAMASGVEGDASLTMLASDPNVPIRDMEHALWLQRQMLEELEESSPVPRLLRVTQSFPYAYGTPAAAAIFEEDGNSGLDAWLRNPPLATLRVRFPEEDHPIEFLRLPLKTLGTALDGRGCEVRHSNVAGVLVMGVLLETYEGDLENESLLRDWSGDRFVHVVCPNGWELGWVTRWTNSQGAAEFARRYRAIAGDLAAVSRLSGPPSVFRSDRTVVVLTPGLIDFSRLFMEASEYRAYGSFSDWLGGNCFPEAACPWGPDEAKEPH